jgi:ATP-dependent helicase/nuclease subunit A
MKMGAGLMREVPFTLTLPARELYPEVKGLGEEIIILQGTIDCLFREGEEYVLIDYKTDMTAPGTIDVLKERYKIQMDLYTRAVETIFGKRVKEKILYSFYLQEAVVF